MGDVQLFTFSKGGEAVGFLTAEHPSTINMVLCDWQLPEVDGLEILRAFRSKNKYSPFFMVSSHTSEYLVRSTKRAGATGYIAKPYVTANVVQLVEKYKSMYEREQAPSLSGPFLHSDSGAPGAKAERRAPMSEDGGGCL